MSSLRSVAYARTLASVSYRPKAMCNSSILETISAARTGLEFQRLLRSRFVVGTSPTPAEFRPRDIEFEWQAYMCKASISDLFVEGPRIKIYLGLEVQLSGLKGYRPPNSVTIGAPGPHDLPPTTKTHSCGRFPYMRSDYNMRWIQGAYQQ